MIIYNDTINIPLPQYLKMRRDEILSVFDNASGWDYNPKAWQQWFADDSVIKDDLNKIIEKCPTKISRYDVRYFASQAHSAGYDELRRLFLTCMIWGWGNGGKYNRGLKNTKAALSDAGLREVLSKTVKLISGGQIIEAYMEFKLHGCGSAFFTKFFYFIGNEYNVKPLPLILDSRVKNFLRYLSRENGQEIWGKLSFSKAEEYVQFVYTIDSWAKELQCLPDNIEYFMFKEGKIARKITLITGKEVKKMDVGSERLPTDAALIFSKEKGLQQEASYIDSLKDIVSSYRLREALFMKLFQKHQCWDEFKEKHWMNGNAENGKKRVKQYENLSKHFLEYLKEISIGQKPWNPLGL